MRERKIERAREGKERGGGERAWEKAREREIERGGRQHTLLGMLLSCNGCTGQKMYFVCRL